MANNVFRVNNTDEYRKAGPTDLIELLPVPGGNPLFLLKWVIEILVYGVVHHEFIHLSGPTGSAKSSLLEALYRVQANFQSVCHGLGYPELPLKIYPVEMATYETPGELYQRRSLKDGTTFDEKSRLVEALEDSVRSKDTCYPLIWLREIGRVYSSSVQGGLLNLMTKGDVVLPDASRIDGLGIGWVADSNYQAEHDSTHTLVTFDDALKRRFSVNLTLDYLSAENEVQVVRHILRERQRRMKRINHDLIVKVVQLGNIMRRHRSEGSLQSVPPPTIYGYLAFLNMAEMLPHMSLQQIAMATLLGNASVEDRKHIPGIFNEVFGISNSQEDDPTMGGNLF